MSPHTLSPLQPIVNLSYPTRCRVLALPAWRLTEWLKDHRWALAFQQRLLPCSVSIYRRKDLESISTHCCFIQFMANVNGCSNECGVPHKTRNVDAERDRGTRKTWKRADPERPAEKILGSKHQQLNFSHIKAVEVVKETVCVLRQRQWSPIKDFTLETTFRFSSTLKKAQSSSTISRLPFQWHEKR